MDIIFDQEGDIGIGRVYVSANEEVEAVVSPHFDTVHEVEVILAIEVDGEIGFTALSVRSVHPHAGDSDSIIVGVIDHDALGGGANAGEDGIEGERVAADSEAIAAVGGQLVGFAGREYSRREEEYGEEPTHITRN